MSVVLVVEDEETYRDALEFVLRKEGFEVKLVANGPDALTEFERSGADIICAHHHGDRQGRRDRQGGRP